jgi:YegS/Rv2252/BmrU family lipid kinase
MSKKSLHFIINPISGTGKQENITSKIEKIIDSSVFESHIHFTERKGHATEIAKDLRSDNADVIIAVGGDGTVNEVAQALVNSKCILGVIPTGSGNGLARHLGIPQNVSKALRLLNTLNNRKIDSCTANGKFFMNVSGMGYDAHISHCFAQKRQRGMKTYVKLILSEWWTYRVKKYQIEIEGETVFDDDAVQVSFANGTQFGNNVIVSPPSIDNDGEIELCILKPFYFYEIPTLLLALATRRFHLNKRMRVIKCSQAIIKSKNAKTHLDGEPKSLGDRVELNVIHQSINIITNQLV